VIDDLAAPDARQHVVFLGVPLRRDDERDVPADGLGRRVAEHPLGGAVPRDDHTLERLAHDRIVGGIDDRGQAGADDVFGCRADHGRKITLSA
jgi:hypothetical protein